jgi:hypothetical protein
MKVLQPAVYSRRLLQLDRLYPTIINRAKTREGEVLRDKTYESLVFTAFNNKGAKSFCYLLFIRAPNSKIRHLMFPYALL